MNKQTVLKNLDEIKQYIKEIENENDVEWVDITNENCPTLKKYGCTPFRMMKKKMRKPGTQEVWNNINFFDAQKEAEKLGYRLPDMRETLALLEQYRATQGEISHKDKEFLGIEELSYDEDVNYEWIDCSGVSFLRGGSWVYAANAGAFTAYLVDTPGGRSNSVGFRCASDPVAISHSKTLKSKKG